MAETRKHRVQVRDELDKALHAALGEPVRPHEPGPAPAAGAEAAEAEPEASARPASPFIAPGSTIAGFTFGPAGSTDEA